MTSNMSSANLCSMFTGIAKSMSGVDGLLLSSIGKPVSTASLVVSSLEGPVVIVNTEEISPVAHYAIICSLICGNPVVFMSSKKYELPAPYSQVEQLVQGIQYMSGVESVSQCLDIVKPYKQSLGALWILDKQPNVHSWDPNAIFLLHHEDMVNEDIFAWMQVAAQQLVRHKNIFF